MSAPPPAALDLAALVDPLLALAREAGAAIMRVYAQDFAVSHKDDRSPLTEADMASHHLIVAGLQRLAADIPVLSEESADVPWDVRRHWTRYWLVDPLDGTREFVKKNGEFTVNIALIEDGETVLGVVYAPALDELHFGARGLGAFVCDGAKRVPVTVRQPALAPLRVAGSRSHMDARSSAFIARLGEHTLLGMGSSLKFCRMAEGAPGRLSALRAHLRVGHCGGQCVLECAGGAVLTPRRQTPALQQQGFAAQSGFPSRSATPRCRGGSGCMAERELRRWTGCARSWRSCAIPPAAVPGTWRRISPPSRPTRSRKPTKVADAIDRGDMAELKDELGDLLLQVVFHARMAEEAGLFDFDAVASAINDKMLRRHPHVFDAEGLAYAEPVARRRRMPAMPSDSCSTGSSTSSASATPAAATPARWPASRAGCRSGSAR
jgi:3'(2'), 5'-bisphosphate nucleotidase